MHDHISVPADQFPRGTVVLIVVTVCCLQIRAAPAAAIYHSGVAWSRGGT